MNSCPLAEQNVLRASKTSETPSSNPVTRGLSRSLQYADSVIEHVAHASMSSNQLVVAL